MSRRLLIVIALLAALVGGGYWTYAMRFQGEPPPVAPEYPDNPQVPLAPTVEFEKLAREDPVKMLGQCLSRYTREVKGGVQFTLEKQERIQGNPKPPEMPVVEVIEGWVRGDVPDPQTHKTAIEVVMKWKSGAKDGLGSEIRGTLFSEKPQPAGLGGKVVTWRPEASLFKMSIPLSPSSAQAKEQSRYCIRDAGLYRSMLRTHEAWKKKQQAGEFKIEYLGKQTPKQIGRECYVIKRICPRLEIDAFEVGGTATGDPKTEGFSDVTIYIDAERWLQVGTELYRTEPDGTRVLVGSYYFRDVQLNPNFPPDAFTTEALKR